MGSRVKKAPNVQQQGQKGERQTEDETHGGREGGRRESKRGDERAEASGGAAGKEDLCSRGAAADLSGPGFIRSVGQPLGVKMTG